MGISFFKGAQITKGYDVGIKSCIDFVNMDKNALLKIDGIKEKTACKIMGSIVANCDNVPIHILAAATPCFQSFGKRRIESIVTQIPDFLTLESGTLLNKIVNMNGFSHKTANMFVSGLPKFKTFLEEYQKVYNVKFNISEAKEIKSGELAGMVFLFSGFRDVSINDIIISKGGSVVERLTSKTNVTHLIVKDISSMSQKVKTAKEKGISIIDKDGLYKLF